MIQPIFFFHRFWKLLLATAASTCHLLQPSSYGEQTAQTRRMAFPSNVSYLRTREFCRKSIHSTSVQGSLFLTDASNVEKAPVIELSHRTHRSWIIIHGSLNNLVFLVQPPNTPRNTQTKKQNPRWTTEINRHCQA